MIDLNIGDIHGSLPLPLALLFILGVLAFPLLPMLIGFATMRRRAKKEKIRRQQNPSVQYEPPRGLNPAEIAYIYNLKLGENARLATLFDLLIRKKVDFTDIHHIALQPYSAVAAPLTAIEQTAISSPGDFNKSVSESLIRKNILRKGRMVTFGRLTATAAGLILLIVFVIASCLAYLAYGLGWPHGNDATTLMMMYVVAPLMSTVLALFNGGIFILYGMAYVTLRIWMHFIGNSWLATKEYSGIWAEIDGYRQFLQAVELPELEFALKSEPEGSPLLRSLPYAIAFDIDVKWQDYLARRAVTPGTANRQTS